mgnify:CR=1 FL=1
MRSGRHPRSRGSSTVRSCGGRWSASVVRCRSVSTGGSEIGRLSRSFSSSSSPPSTASPLSEALVEAVTPEVEHAFRHRLPAWFDGARRDMPWREVDANGNRDPYRVWISEIMLQQTRVDTAIPYFHRFVDRFPTVTALAEAPIDDVLKMWEGLGYYSRARNLHRAARLVLDRHDGVIPSDPEAFRSLPGVGPYTQAAVLSLSFGEPLAVLDGNVIRELARTFGDAP